MTEPRSVEVLAPVLLEPKRPLEVLALEVSPPERREVRVRMAASGVCHSCLHAADGTHEGLPLPMVLGDEGAGIVEAVGPDVTSLAVGDHVIVSWAPGCGSCRFCAVGRPGLCVNAPPFGVMADGRPRFARDGEPVYHYGPATFAPLTVVHERAAVKIPRDVPLDRAALIGCCVTTGFGAVVNTASVRPGDSVAVFGCGGVGLNAIQGAAASGAFPIIAVDLVAERLEIAERLGATAGVDAGGSDAAERIRELTGTGVDFAIATVGSTAVIEQAWESVGPGGTCVIVGNPPTSSPPLRINAHDVLQGERRLVGSVYGSSTPAVDFIRYVALYRGGVLKLDELIAERFSPDQANEAFDALIRGDAGRGVIVLDEELAPPGGSASR